VAERCWFTVEGSGVLNMKIAAIADARPRFIKASAVSWVLRATEGVKEALILANSVNIKKVKLTI